MEKADHDGVMLLGGVILLVIAAVSATCAVVMLARANPHAALPWLFRKPPRSPWQGNALSGLAGGTGVLSALLLFDTLGYWAFLAIIGAGTVAIVIQYEHNRDVSRDPTTTRP